MGPTFPGAKNSWLLISFLGLELSYKVSFWRFLQHAAAHVQIAHMPESCTRTLQVHANFIWKTVKVSDSGLKLIVTALTFFDTLLGKNSKSFPLP
jgi:hypothetical protein